MAPFRTLALLSLALVVPGIAAGLAYPSTPVLPAPVTFHPGTDAASAQGMGLVGDLSFSSDRTSYHVSLRGLSGGSVLIDSLVRTEAAPTTLYRFEVADAFEGSLDPVALRMRAWNGPTPPSHDQDRGVCAALDLLVEAPTLDLRLCRGPVHLQFLLDLPTNADGAGEATIRPTAIALV